MGGTKATFSIVTALALALGGPAPAAADGPLDAAALQAVQQQATAVVAPAAQQLDAIVHQATPVVTPTVAPKPAPKPAAATHVEVAPATNLSIQESATAPRLALVEAPPADRRADEPGPPPHGHEASPAARSRPGRARVASSHSKLAADTSAAHQAPSEPPPAPWKARNPLLGLGRAVGNPAAAIQLGWLLMLIVGAGFGGRMLLRRVRAT